MSLDPKSNYYDFGGIETMNIIKAKLTPEQYLGFCLGNSIKYLSRFNSKNQGSASLMARDIEKAKVYLEEVTKILEEEESF